MKKFIIDKAVFLLKAMGALFAVFAAAVLVVWFTLPDTGWLKNSNPESTAMMLYKEKTALEKGVVPYRMYEWVGLSEISPYLVKAVIIAEDGKFYKHHGVDWEATKNAIETNIRKNRMYIGGSTITQQLAKNLFFSPKKNVIRKAREILAAYKLERELSKERILELYLNVADWGHGAYGAEAASRVYFVKPASELTPSEAARLASVLPNPARYSPLDDTKKWLTRKREELILLMLKRRWIEESLVEPSLADFRCP
ncbi:MAG: monofunctional biosynthetic peptidoglycan transglycosylase [Elusimicrobia bacterium]|nr:monofunctional biosynthetic peptidoglycan transglycosylase [Elusimicrobiota bacterium]